MPRAKRRTAGAAPTAKPAPRRGHGVRDAAIVAAAGIASYLNSLHGPFILDDRPHIIENPHLRALWPPWDALRHTTRPLVDLTLAVNYALGGLAVTGYHVVNVALHVAAGLALWALARTTLGRTGPAPADRERTEALALAIALLWIVHPLHTQAVAYVIQRGEVLAGLFAFLTLLALARSASAPNAHRWPVLAVVCCALGMASKQVMVAVPLVALAYDRILLADSWRAVWRARGRLHALLFASMLLLPLFLRWAPDEWQGTAGFGTTGVTPLRYAAAQPFAIARYLRLAFWPADLCLDYGWPAPAAAAQGVALAVLAAIVAVTAWLLVRRRRAAFLGLAFAIPIAVTSSFIPTADPVFEHRMYVPLAAVIAAVVLGGDALLRRQAARAGGTPRAVPLAATVLVVAAAVGLTARTVARNRDYASEIAIWSNTVGQRPLHARPRNALALALLAAGRTEAAAAQLDTAIRVEPGYPDAHGNRGLVLLQRGHTAQARAEFEEALRLDPQSVSARANLGLAMSNAGRLDVAEAQLTQAVAMNPPAAGPYASLGIVLAKLGRDDQAARRFQQALSLTPDDPNLHAYLGAAFARLGREADAQHAFERALELAPGQAMAQLGLGRLLSKQQHFDQAMPHLEQAVRLDSTNADARAELGIASVLAGRADEGERHLRRALDLEPRSARALAGMGLVCSGAGRDAEAADWFARAIAVTPSDAALRVQLGAVEAQLGRADEARRQFRAALAIEPGNVAARWGLQQLDGAGK